MDALHIENSTTVRSLNDDLVHDAAARPQAFPPRPAEASWLRRDWRFQVVRAGMRLLSAVSPALATAGLDRLWFTAPRTRPRADARRWLAGAEPLDVRVHGHRIAAWAWGRGPTILLVHGWGGHAGQMQAIGEGLLERGYRVVAFDAPAHGASGPSRLGGQRVSMLEIADSLRVVAAAAGPIEGVVAHSGGCTATALALRDGWQGPKRIAFVAPFGLPSLAIEPFARIVGASASATARFRSGVERRFARPWSDFDMPGLADTRPLPPALVVHDRDDHEVPPFNGQAIAAAWPAAHWLETTGLGHRRVLRDPGVIDGIAGFFAPLRPRRAVATPAQARGELDQVYASAAKSG